MPFTPLHLGFGLIAGTLVRRIDVWAFAAVNVLIDLEPGWNIWRGSYPAHRFFHTLPGATLLIVPAVALAVLVTHVAARRRLLRARTGVGAAILGATLGAWSHVLLDAITHGGATPPRP